MQVSEQFLYLCEQYEMLQKWDQAEQYYDLVIQIQNKNPELYFRYA